MLPPYFRPIPTRIGADELSYLDTKGAFSIPDASLRDELLRCFLDYVYPTMPVVEFSDTVRIISQGDGVAGRMSLLLFQAIMFAGCAFVDLSMLYHYGFQDRMHARKVFARKVRVSETDQMRRYADSLGSV